MMTINMILSVDYINLRTSNQTSFKQIDFSRQDFRSTMDALQNAILTLTLNNSLLSTDFILLQ
jgi:hypothetical protein